MKRRKRVSKGGKTARPARPVRPKKTISLRASAEGPPSPPQTIEEFLGLYKPRKKAVTLRLDADVLGWFRKPGRGYQTRINRALRKVMREEKEAAAE